MCIGLFVLGKRSLKGGRLHALFNFSSGPLHNADLPVAPYVVSAVVVAGLFFCLTIPFTNVLANAFSRACIW